MQSKLHGEGGISEAKIANNNLSDNSAALVKQMMSMVLGVEFFTENKQNIYANNIVIEDTSSGRKFEFTLTAKEI